MGKIRVVIADDSSMARGLLREILGNEPDIEVVGEACDGRRAVELARELKPDLMTIDLEMPLMNGLAAIDEIMHAKAVPILVVSSAADAQNALAAVGCGALEVVAKPDFTPQASADFVAKVRLLAGVSVITRMRVRKAPPLAVAQHAPAVPPAPTFTATQPAAMQSAVLGDYARVFAIASSTGGPQALAEILPLLPRDFPCPVLIAQHIADGFAGGMAEWLASLCKLPVRLAVEGEPLQPGVVLVSPSERHLTISPARRVVLVECHAADVYHPNCDLLLNSVADVFGRRAVGIILTGMGSDGAKGLARIAEKGGTTLGQDEASSVIYGMNRVAIESGVVHQVLPMNAVAATMIGLADPFRLPEIVGAGGGGMSFDLASFKMLIKERCGLLFEGHGEEKLANALAERADAVGASPRDYYLRLHGDDGEFQLLVNLLTINETYFFREPEQIRLLIERLAPRMLAARATAGSTAPLRILSAGCSSGEEPYSLAMGMLDKFGEAALRQFTFAGGDIDSTVLAKARDGRYTDFSFRGVPDDVRARYFRKERWSNLLDDRVKRLVSFFELNLLAESFPPELQGFDIVFFRNVSIYFDMETRKVIQRNLASLMKADGILVIGTAETLANDLGVLPLVEEDGLFYFVKGKPALPDHVTQASTTVAREALPPLISSLQSAAALAAASVLKAPLPVPPPLVPPGAWSLPVVTPAATDARRLAEERRWDEALPVLDALLAATPGNVEALLLKAYVLINRKDFAAAEALAQRVLDVNAWSVDAFLLLGLAAKWRQLNETAIKWFKQAAYARHECWPAHYYLADLYRGVGETEQARRAYRVVIQLLAGAAPDTGIRHVPLGLPLGEIRFLCEHQLAKLSGAQTLAVQK